MPCACVFFFWGEMPRGRDGLPPSKLFIREGWICRVNDCFLRFLVVDIEFFDLLFGSIYDDLVD
jgi:hypothetical protein